MQIRKKWLLVFLALCMLLTACSPADDPNQTVSSNDTPAPTDEPPGDDIVLGERAYVEAIHINIMESFPLQVSVTVQGQLPNGCTTVSETIAEQQDDSTFQVSIITQYPKDAMCTEAEVPFEVNVPLDVYGLPAGTYTVQVYELSETFTFTQDNIIPDLEDPCAAVMDGTRPIREENPEDNVGFCFLYPDDFEPISPGTPRRLRIGGPAHGEQQAALTVEITESSGISLEDYVQEQVDTLGMGSPDVTVSDIGLGGNTAFVVDGLPANVKTRVVYAMNSDRIYTLTFVPADETMGAAYNDMLSLYRMILETWGFTQ